MGRFDDIDPQDIDPETGAPYAGYSSPSLDTSFHDHEMDVDESPAEAMRGRLNRLADEAYAKGDLTSTGLVRLQESIDELEDESLLRLIDLAKSGLL